MEAVEEFESQVWDPKVIRENAERFSIDRFRENFSRVTKKEWTEFLVQRVENNRNSMFGLSDIDIAVAAMPAPEKPAPARSGGGIPQSILPDEDISAAELIQ